MSTLAPSFLFRWCPFLQVTKTVLKPWMNSEFGKMGPGSEESEALERLAKFTQIYNRKNVLTTLAPSFLIGWS